MQQVLLAEYLHENFVSAPQILIEGSDNLYLQIGISNGSQSEEEGVK